MKYFILFLLLSTQLVFGQTNIDNINSKKSYKGNTELIAYPLNTNYIFSNKLNPIAIGGVNNNFNLHVISKDADKVFKIYDSIFVVKPIEEGELELNVYSINNTDTSFLSSFFLDVVDYPEVEAIIAGKTNRFITKELLLANGGIIAQTYSDSLINYNPKIRVVKYNVGSTSYDTNFIINDNKFGSYTRRVIKSTNHGDAVVFYDIKAIDFNYPKDTITIPDDVTFYINDKPIEGEMKSILENLYLECTPGITQEEKNKLINNNNWRKIIENKNLEDYYWDNEILYYTIRYNYKNTLNESKPLHQSFTIKIIRNKKGKPLIFALRYDHINMLETIYAFSRKKEELKPVFYEREKEIFSLILKEGTSPDIIEVFGRDADLDIYLLDDSNNSIYFELLDYNESLENLITIKKGYIELGKDYKLKLVE